ncbi:MAG: hypothetical protein PW786_09325, partial [Arachidicoccus sp.]|nr:hypothetical protein [Arachidicoccus sp.]
RNGITVAASTVLDKPVSNTVAGSQTKNANQNMAVFFNFSVGMKQKLGTNTNFSIEPFVSVPMNGNFNRQNIHLTNAGVRIKFGL